MFSSAVRVQPPPVTASDIEEADDAEMSEDDFRTETEEDEKTEASAFSKKK